MLFLATCLVLAIVNPKREDNEVFARRFPVVVVVYCFPGIHSHVSVFFFEVCACSLETHARGDHVQGLYASSILEATTYKVFTPQSCSR